MGDDKKTTTTSLGWLFWAFVWGAVGYLIYGDAQGAIVLALFSAVTGLTAILGLLPIVGVWLTYMATNYIKTWMLQYVAMSWAVSIIFWMTLAMSVLLTIIVLVLIVLMVID